jgi:hypothetical protein
MLALRGPHGLLLIGVVQRFEDGMPLLIEAREIIAAFQAMIPQATPGHFRSMAGTDAIRPRRIFCERHPQGQAAVIGAITPISQMRSCERI